jgi:hypothetical protein
MTSWPDHFHDPAIKTILARSVCASEAERSGLLAHIAAMESVSSFARMNGWPRMSKSNGRLRP